jgi:hypothetical protein
LRWVGVFISEEKSAASFCCQVAAWIPDMFCNLNLVKNHEIANNSASTEAREKISKDVTVACYCHWRYHLKNYANVNTVLVRFSMYAGAALFCLVTPNRSKTLGGYKKTSSYFVNSTIIHLRDLT